MEFRRYNTKVGEVIGTELDVRDISQWRATIPQLREAIQLGMIVAPNLADDHRPELEMAARYAPSQYETENLSDMAQEAVAGGRLIDFGFLPNDVIKQGGNRGGPLYSKKAFGHPFRSPWLLFHTWEHGGSLYLVNPLEENTVGGDCEVAELEPVMHAGHRVLMVGDRALLEPDEAIELEWGKYPCRVIPSMWRYMPGAEDTLNRATTPEGAAAGNVLDPLMTALLMLSTNGIERETVRVSDKLNKARVKSRKPVIPPYDRVLSESYVTAILSRKTTMGDSRGGTHASPVAHLRRGHLRTYATGKQTFIRDSLVNFTDEARAAFAAKRSHYTVR